MSSLLKQFIRDLPVPLLTMENLPAFAMLADIADLKERLRTLNLLILMLPTLHQRVLKVKQYSCIYCMYYHSCTIISYVMHIFYFLLTILLAIDSLARHTIAMYMYMY